MSSTIIIKNSATSGSVPSSLVQGEFGINVTNGKLYYGSGSGNVVKEFNSASYASFAVSASYAATASNSQNAQDILVYVKNVSGAQINKGKVVRISGATGDNALIVTASYTNDANSANTLGITYQNIANDSFGYVITEGTLVGINTSAFTAGQLLYLGDTGSIIGTAPVAPLHAVRLGEVLRVQLNNGSMYVRIDNGYELGELHDVVDTTTTSSYGDLLVKSGSVWTNSKQLTGSYGLTGSLNILGSITATSASITYLVSVFETSSTIYSSGSNQFGDDSNDLQTLYGTVDIKTGPVLVTGSLNAPSITGSLLGTASFASNGLINWTQSFSSVSQSTSQLTPFNTATTVNAAIVPKGSGSLLANIPDGTTVGGMARGAYSVDLQMIRTNANQVVSSSYSVITGGRNNRITQVTTNESFIGGGLSNTIGDSAQGAVIAGGQSNAISSSPRGSIVGGTSNTLSSRGDNSTIAGGSSNSIFQYGCFIGAGGSNSVNGRNGAVVAGESNSVSGHTGNHCWSSIVGGSSNSAAPAGYSFIGGGNANTVANSWYATIGGGQRNSSRGFYNFIGGGTLNSGSSQTAVTSATVSYTASSAIATVSGSNTNIKVGQILFLSNSETPSTLYVRAISGSTITLSANASSTVSTSTSFYTPHAVVVGGGNNIASGSYSFVGGGGDGGTATNRNAALGDWSLVVGGRSNIATQNFSSIVGGEGNLTSGLYSFIGGGLSNTASADYAFAFGRRAKAINTGSFVWADSADADYSSNGNDTFNVRATGGSFFTGSMTVTGSLTVAPSSNVELQVLSTGVRIGNLITDVHTVTGSLGISGSVIVTGSISATSFTGSLLGTASFATSASHASTASFVNPLIQTVQITGSLTTTGSNTLIGNTFLTGSLNVTGSTTQTGNNTLIGNTSLSGSLIISGSQGTVTPNIQIFGDVNQTGYTRYLPISSNIDNSISASYIYVSGSTNDLYFSQNSSGYSNTTRLRWLEGNLYTGLLHGGVITAVTGSTTYNISSGSGIIVNLNASLNDDPYPTIQYLNWGNLSASIAPFTASFQQCFVGIDSTNNIFAQGTPFSNGQFDAIINIGNVLFQNQSTINGVKTQPSVAYGFEQQQNVFNRAFGPLKLSGYTLAPSGSSTGSLIVGSGTAYSPGSNYVIDPNEPYYTVDSGTNISKIFRYYQSGSTWVYLSNAGAGFGAIDPTRYSNNGALTLVPSPVGSNWTIQRVFWFPNSVTKAIVVYYGNNYYGSETEAIANINIESFVEAPNTAANAIYLGAIVISGNGVFTNANDFTIVPGGLFRQVGGSGGGGSVITQTLSGLSDVLISGPTNGQPLVYDTTAAKWENKSTLTATLIGNASTATTASFASSGTGTFSGSFSGSFQGNGSGLTNIPASGIVGLNLSQIASGSFTASISPTTGFAVNTSASISGSLTVAPASAVELQVTSTGVKIGNASTDTHTVTGSLQVAGQTRISGSFNTAISGTILTVVGSGSTQPIFTVQGSQGELFSVTDSLTGSLFSVNDISGLPILEVFSDSTTNMGNYLAPALYTTNKITQTNSGSFVVYSLPTASYDGAFYDYTVRSGSNARAGQIMAIWSGSSVNFTETTTTDFGSTSAINFTVIVSGSNMVLTGSSATGSWTIKTIIRSI